MCTQINKNPSTGRIPLGEADTNTTDCTLREGALAAAAVAQKTPRSVARPPPVVRSAAPPPAPPPMPAKGSLFAGMPRHPSSSPHDSMTSARFT